MMSETHLENTVYDNREVAQGNPLIEASKCFTAVEGRLFYLAVMELKQHFPNSKYYDTEFFDMIIPAETVIRVLGGNSRLYTDLVKIAEKLLKKTISIKVDKGNGEFKWIGYTIFRRMEFDTEGGGLIIRFSDDMKPYLLELHKTPFTNVNSRIVFALKSVYAVRLMELMLKYKNAPYARKGNQIVWKYDLADLRIFFQLEDNQYRLPKDFRSKCIENPIFEINNSTRYHMIYETIKKGRRITGFEFTLTLPEDFDQQEKAMATVQETIAKAECKETAKAIKRANEYLLPPEDIILEPLSSENMMLDRLKAKGILKGTARRWLKSAGYDKMVWVERYVDERANHGTVQNYGAYYRSIMDSNIYENAIVEEARQDVINKKRQAQYEAQLARHDEEVKKEEESFQQQVSERFYEMSIEQLQSFVDMYQRHLDKITAEPNSDPAAVARTYDTLEKYKNRIRELQKQALDAEYGTDYPKQPPAPQPQQSIGLTQQQQIDLSALLAGLVNAKRIT